MLKRLLIPAALALMAATASAAEPPPKKQPQGHPHSRAQANGEAHFGCLAREEGRPSRHEAAHKSKSPRVRLDVQGDIEVDVLVRAREDRPRLAQPPEGRRDMPLQEAGGPPQKPDLRGKPCEEFDRAGPQEPATR